MDKSVTNPFDYGKLLKRRDDAIQQRIRWNFYDPIDDFLRGYHGRRRKKDKQWRSPTSPAYVSPGRKLRRVVGFVAILAMLIPFGSLAYPKFNEAIFGAAIRLFPKELTGQINMNASCAKRKAIYVESGKRVGWARIAPACSDNNTRLAKSRYRSTDVPTKDALKLVKALEVLEGEISGRYVFQNINFKGLLRSIVYCIKKSCIGGSNMTQSIIESVAGYPNGLGIWEKLKFVFLVGPHFTAHNLRSREARARFIATNMQCARGAVGGGFGSPIAGELCALLFGKNSLADLNQGEQCIVGASVAGPLAVPIRIKGTTQLQLYDKSFNKIKERAKVCAVRMAGSDTARYIEIVKQIDAVPLPKLESFRDLDLRLNENFPGAVQFLREQGVVNSNKKISITLSQTKQINIAKNSRNYLNKIVAPLLNSKLCLKNCPDGRQADFAIIVAEAVNGELPIRAVYQTRARLLSGPVNGLPHRSLGSASKELYLPLFAELGLTKLCRKKWAGLHDASGYAGGDCSRPNDWLSISDATARSSNLAFAWGLKNVPEERLRSYLLALGYNFAKTMTFNELVRSAVTGERVTISPLNLMRAYASLSFAGDYNVPTVVVTPIKNYSLNFPASGQSIIKSRRIMPYPATSQYGTARSALPILKGADCKVLAAKTGTADGYIANRFRDKVIVIAARCGNRQFISFALVGSPDVRIPLGRVQSRELVVMAAKSIAAASK